MADPLTIGIVAAPALKAAAGAIQSVGARRRRRELGERKGFSISPEMERSYQDALREAEFGFSPEETSAFQQRMAQNRQSILNRGQMVGGGGVAQALNAAVLGGQIGAELDFASRDANLRRVKRQYADQRGDVISTQRNRIDADRLAYRDAVERALGAAGSQGRTNIVEGLSELPYAALAAKYFDNPSKSKEVVSFGDTPLRRTQPFLQMRFPTSSLRDFQTPDIKIPSLFGSNSIYSLNRPGSILENR